MQKRNKNTDNNTKRFALKKCRRNSLMSTQEKNTKGRKNPLTKHTLEETLGSHRQWLESDADHTVDFGSKPEKHLDPLHLFES